MTVDFYNEVHILTEDENTNIIEIFCEKLDLYQKLYKFDVKIETKNKYMLIFHASTYKSSLNYFIMGIFTQFPNFWFKNICICDNGKEGIFTGGYLNGQIIKTTNILYETPDLNSINHYLNFDDKNLEELQLKELQLKELQLKELQLKELQIKRNERVNCNKCDRREDSCYCF